MMRILPKLLSALFMAAIFCATTMAAEIDAVQGKWKADQEMGDQKVTFHMEIKDDKFKFAIKGLDGETRFVAKGKVKVEKLGTFRTLALLDISWGQTEDELQPVDDTRTYVFVTGDRTMTLAGNFDRERDNEKANLTVYKKE